MPEMRHDSSSTLTLNTKVEKDFVAPLTAVRGSLEILRDYSDLGEEERLRFITTALDGCHLLERSIKELADSVYAAGQTANQTNKTPDTAKKIRNGFVDRIHIHEDVQVMELDFSGIVFSSSDVVNEIHDVIDSAIEETDQKWFFLINHTDCRVWPEAWVAFAHRGKKIRVNNALGIERYADVDDQGSTTESYPSREEAIAISFFPRHSKT